MKLIKSFINSYFRVLIFYLLAMYLVTAPPTGAFVFRWNILNVVLTISYLICYPFLIYFFPKMKAQRLKLTSPGTKALRQVMRDNDEMSQGYRSSINPIVSRDRLLMKNETNDGLMTAELSFFIQGLLLLIASPLFLLCCLFLVFKRRF